MVDYIVTSKHFSRIDEWKRPRNGYVIAVGIPAAFTPVCSVEMEELNQMHKMGLDVTPMVLMLDNPNSIMEWLKQNNWHDIVVLVSEYAAQCYDLDNLELSFGEYTAKRNHERPILRKMVVEYNETDPSSSPMTVSSATHTTLLTYECDMGIKRDFMEAVRVVKYHEENHIS